MTSRLTALLLLLLCLSTLTTVSKSDETPPDAASEADLLAEEMAAAAVEEAAEEEEEDESDALDEDADAARLDSGKHPLTDIPPPATDVQIAHAFTTPMRGTLTLGETLKTVVAFANEGRLQYHVWGVMGSLNMAMRSDVFVQNFTYGVVNKTVLPGNELSFAYSFTPNERLDPRDFRLSLNVFYEAQGGTGKAIRGHGTTFFNETVATVPGKESMSNGLFMLLFALFVVGVGGGVWMLNMMGEKKQVEMGTKVDRNEWLEEHHTMATTGGGRIRNRPNAKK